MYITLTVMKLIFILQLNSTWINIALLYFVILLIVNFATIQICTAEKGRKAIGVTDRHESLCSGLASSLALLSGYMTGVNFMSTCASGVLEMAYSPAIS